MRLLARHTVHLGIKTREPDSNDKKDKGDFEARIVAPGETFDIDDEEEGRRLLKLGAAVIPGDPKAAATTPPGVQVSK